MKTIFKFIIAITLGIFSFAANAQELDKISDALSTGNATEVALFFDKNVELTTTKEGASYSKAQAEVILRKFFEENVPTGFKPEHQGTSPEGSRYIIGTFTTTTSKFRVYVYAKPLDNKVFRVQELRFEKQKD